MSRKKIGWQLVFSSSLAGFYPTIKYIDMSFYYESFCKNILIKTKVQMSEMFDSNLFNLCFYILPYYFQILKFFAT